MDSLQRSHYRQCFKIAFLEKQGAAFEDLFSTIMAHAHPGTSNRSDPTASVATLKAMATARVIATPFSATARAR